MSPGIRWTAVVPVKRTEHAKSRLAGAQAHLRRQVALAVAADTVAALQRSESVAATIVVTDDDAAAQAVRTLGARVVADVPDAGLNPALTHGAERASAWYPEAGVVLVSADLPAARAHEVDLALSECARHPRSFVCDVAGTGTTMLAGLPGERLHPLFGRRSRSAHHSDGCIEVRRRDIVSVRRDVDTWVDLWDAARLGLGPATQQVWDQLDRLR